MLETELAKPIANWLRGRGYTVYAEIWIGPTDLVGYNSENDDIIIVELKTSCTQKVLRQAYLKQLATQHVYIGIGTRPRKTSLTYCERYGLGCLSVRSGVVTEILKAHMRYPPMKHHRDGLLECISLSDPSDMGGIPNPAGEGPAQDCLIRIKDYVDRHPTATWREIFAEVPNHYSDYRSMACAMRSWLKFSLMEYKGSDTHNIQSITGSRSTAGANKGFVFV